MATRWHGLLWLDSPEVPRAPVTHTGNPSSHRPPSPSGGRFRCADLCGSSPGRLTHSRPPQFSCGGESPHAWNRCAWSDRGAGFHCGEIGAGLVPGDAGFGIKSPGLHGAQCTLCTQHLCVCAHTRTSCEGVQRRLVVRWDQPPSLSIEGRGLSSHAKKRKAKPPQRSQARVL